MTTDRVAFLKGFNDKTKTILEIGAGYNPIAPKRDGWKTHVVDHAPRADLVAKYGQAKDVDVNLIEEVDTVWSSGPLHEAIPSALVGKVDIIIASHVLEHFPDLLGFLRSADHVVAEDGVITVAYPDRRYCFDCYRPWSTTGQVLQAHLSRDAVHPLHTAFDHHAYSALSDGRLAWGPAPYNPPQLIDPFAVAADILRTHFDVGSGEYKDYHAWQFSPAGFELVMLELRALGLMRWWIEKLEGPTNFEFFARLRHRADAPVLNVGAFQEKREELALRQLVEVKEQADFLLAAGTPRVDGRKRLFGILEDK